MAEQFRGQALEPSLQVRELAPVLPQIEDNLANLLNDITDLHPGPLQSLAGLLCLPVEQAFMGAETQRHGVQRLDHAIMDIHRYPLAFLQQRQRPGGGHVFEQQPQAFLYRISDGKCTHQQTPPGWPVDGNLDTWQLMRIHEEILPTAVRSPWVQHRLPGLGDDLLNWLADS